MSQRFSGYVGVFDSGVGGISVLRALADTLPCEDFVFFGDSAHAPYGEKTREEVVSLSRGIVERLLGEGAKAIVIACNTATSAAAAELRAEYDVPIIGVEPALKPATLSEGAKRILVMATPITLQLDKYQQLAEKWGGGHEVISAPCPGLAARIEQGDLDAPDVLELLQQLVGPYAGNVDCVVLGCTHYPFVARQICQVIGDVPLFDGAQGTALQLRRKLDEAGLTRESHIPGRVEFLSSKPGNAEIELYRTFFEAAASA